jgi:HEAT repeat protein
LPNPQFGNEVKPRVVILLITACLPIPLLGDSVDDAVARLSSGEPAAIYKVLIDLRDSRDPRLVEPLWNILLGEDIFVRIPDETAARSHPVALKPLARALLAKSQGDVVALAIANLDSTNPVARREAAELLARFSQPAPDALTSLKTLLRDDSGAVRLAAIRAVGNQGTSAIKPLLAHLKKVAREPDVDEAAAVTTALARFRDDARTILPELTPYLDATKYPGMVISCVLQAVEPLGYARDAPEENWDLVLPALIRLKHQARNKVGKVPLKGLSLAEYIQERIEFRKRLRTSAPK